MSGLVKRSIALAGHRTSIALEPLFWETLESMARDQGSSLAGLIAAVDASREADSPLASALRVTVLRAALDRPPRDTRDKFS